MTSEEDEFTKIVNNLKKSDKKFQKNIKKQQKAHQKTTQPSLLVAITKRFATLALVTGIVLFFYTVARSTDITAPQAYVFFSIALMGIGAGIHSTFYFLKPKKVDISSDAATVNVYQKMQQWAQTRWDNRKSS